GHSVLCRLDTFRSTLASGPPIRSHHSLRTVEGANMTRLSDHLAVAPSQRDMDWLLSALQCAIELEHATIPLYLSAMFSLQVHGHTVYNLIRRVAMEELVHMAIACNMLAALDGTPRIKALTPKFPSDGLALAKLSKRQVQNFKRIEMPRSPIEN